MSKLQIHTGDDRKQLSGRAVDVSGSVVMVGSETLDQVFGVSLEAEVGSTWVAVIRVRVDPNDLFQPKVATAKESAP